MTTYGRAKSLIKQALQNDHDKARIAKVSKLQDELRKSRQHMLELDVDKIPDGLDITLEQWREACGRAQEVQTNLYAELEAAKANIEVELPTRPDLVELLKLQDSDVVFHYKRNMDDKSFLPEYCEGVQWLLSVPKDPPSLCEFDSRWSTPREGGAKSELEEVEHTLRVLFEKDVRGMLSAQEKEEWEIWLAEQKKGDASPVDYADESPWVLPLCKPTDEIDINLNSEEQNMSEVITHAGYTAATRRAEKSELKKQQRLEDDMKRAAEMAPIAAKDFVVYWEAVVDTNKTEDDMRTEYAGLSMSELLCPLVLGRAVRSWDPANPMETVEIHRYRQPAADMNRVFFPGILAASNAKWIVEIARDSIVLVGPEFLKAGKGGGVRLSGKTKKQLCEIPIVRSQFFMEPKKGMVRGFGPGGMMMSATV